MNALKWLFLIALAGHLLCGLCDCLLIYMPNGRFRAEYMKDGRKLAEVFDGMPLRNSVLSMVLGCFAMCMMFFGYMAIYTWMRQYSAVYADLILLSIGLIFTFGMAHHVLCGVPEWLYVRHGRTEEAREIITELFKKTSVTMRSLKALESNLRKREVKPKIITGHTGWTDDLDFAFRHIDKVCNSLVRQKPHDPDAPYDGYEESEDTEERARSVLLAKQKDLQ